MVSRQGKYGGTKREGSAEHNFAIRLNGNTGCLGASCPERRGLSPWNGPQSIETGIEKAIGIIPGKREVIVDSIVVNTSDYDFLVRLNAYRFTSSGSNGSKSRRLGSDRWAQTVPRDVDSS